MLIWPQLPMQIQIPSHRRETLRVVSNGLFVTSFSRGSGVRGSWTEALDVDLARDVAEQFRVDVKKRETIINEVSEAVSHWHQVATKYGISRGEMQKMEAAFRT